MSRKPKYQLSNLEIGEKFKVKTTPLTSQKDVHCLRSAISQYKRLYNKSDQTFGINLSADKNTIVCQRMS